MPSYSSVDSCDSLPRPCRRIIVSHRLPLRAVPDAAAPFGFAFSLDPDALALQLSSGLPPPVSYVGALPSAAAACGGCGGGVDDDLAAYLKSRFSCLPVFIPRDLHGRFYDGFCKHYLWPVLHYLLPVGSAAPGGIMFDRALYRSYLSVNKLFADRVLEILSPDGDFVVVHDYHLMALPTFLRHRSPRVRLGFFLHSPFPSSEILRALPAREDLLRALLNADLVGFQTYDYARHFLSCCSRLLGLGHRTDRGYIAVDYYGRAIIVKILAVGVDLAQLRSSLSSPEAAAKACELAETYKGRALLVGVDDVDLFKGVGLKFLAMERLLEERPEMRGRAVLVQINNPARTQGRDVEEVQREMAAVTNRINARFGSPGYTPVVIVDGGLMPMHEKAAYYAVADCCIVNAVRDGLNRIPYFFTVCQQESPLISSASDSLARRMGVIVLSEFIGCSPSLSGAIRVNPWNVESVAEAISRAVMMPVVERQLRHQKHYKYVSSHDVVYWTRSFDQDLQHACRHRNSDAGGSWAVGLGMSFRVVAFGPNFTRLHVERILPSFRRSVRRLILLDYDGTIRPATSIDKAPSRVVIDVLNQLCSDPKNTVFVVSGRGKDELDKWFAPCNKLGIAAEHGYFTRWHRDLPWESCTLYCGDFNWKRMVEPVMKSYVESTDGSFIEAKETAMVWHHREADLDFGSFQAKELLDHLESILANEPVAVKGGQHIVEVNPQGISKGVAVEKIINTMLQAERSPDFILCVGDDRSDEDMFESIATLTASSGAHVEVFTCTVGTKPSLARYYLDETDDVIRMLQNLANACPEDPSRPPAPNEVPPFEESHQ